MRQNKKTVSPMSNEGRNQYVVEHITKALLKLMRRQNFSEISISRMFAHQSSLNLYVLLFLANFVLDFSFKRVLY